MISKFKVGHIIKSGRSSEYDYLEKEVFIDDAFSKLLTLYFSQAFLVTDIFEET